jgi:hypothetical protein
MSNYADAALPARAGGALNDDLYISAQESQEVHKPLGGKSGEPALQQARNLWLVNLQDAGGAGLGEAAGANRFGDANGEISFGEALFWLRQADVGEYIAAAFLVSPSDQKGTLNLGGFWFDLRSPGPTRIFGTYSSLSTAACLARAGG